MAGVAEAAAVGEKAPGEQLLLGFPVAPRVLSLGLRLRWLPVLYCLTGQVPTFGRGALVAGQAGWQGGPLLRLPSSSTGLYALTRITGWVSGGLPPSWPHWRIQGP